MNIKSAKIKILLYILSLLAIVFLTIFIVYSLFNLNKYTSSEKAIVTITDEIKKANEKSASLNSKELDSKQTGKDIKKISTALTKEASKLSKLSINDKYKTLIFNLKNGIKNNILLYKQLEACANNPDAPDIDASMNSLNTYKNLSTKYYSKITINNEKFSLPDNTLKFIDSFQTYFTIRKRNKTDKNFSLSMSSDFDNTMDAICTQFNLIRTDFSDYATKTRKKIISYDYAFDKINKNDAEFINLENNFQNLSVPSNRIDIYKDFNLVLNDYVSYINNFISALNYESNLKDASVSSSDINDIYKEAKDAFKKTTKDYNTFEKKYISEKNK
ncbi:hypothetical protein [Clostridium guangxiense]|uniref:hypothetical protein n=1 Tax=Clostridium guangxiense TaxID=1662055 RepID=UPI001E31B383|nr:hypothetical protein [Clostridium guangxiense]MCD2347491.1 hypothetical protein [Clostridium guangxiense]